MDSDEAISISSNESYLSEDGFEFENENDDEESYDNFFEIISSNKVVEEMNKYVLEVQSIMNISKQKAKLLLCQFRWDKEDLLTKFYDGNRKDLFEQSGIDEVLPMQPDAEMRNPDDTIDCEVCFGAVKVYELTGLECGHQFCLDCWREYLKTKIRVNGVADTIECAAPECKVLVDEDTVMKLLTDPQDKALYKRLLAKSFVESNKLMIWCPSPHCNNAIRALYTGTFKPITCKCNLTFCFACGNAWHEPVTCEILKKWLKKCDDDSETSKWISANTKDCPNCKAPIEKNGGCNFMKCNKKLCGHEFCWLCMGRWSEHKEGHFKCSNYNEATALEARNKQDKNRADLNRYLFYANRYSDHLQSLKLEGKLIKTVQEKMNNLQNDHSQSWASVQYLMEAVGTLRACRQVLMYTYVFGFYNKKNNQVYIFEDNQNDLQMAVENLSAVLERELDVDDYTMLKGNIVDKCKYCEARRKKLLDHVVEGTENNWWEFLNL